MSIQSKETPGHISGRIENLFTNTSTLTLSSHHTAHTANPENTILENSSVATNQANQTKANQAKLNNSPKFIKPKKKKICFLSSQERAQQEAITKKLIDEAILSGKITHHPARWAQDSRSMQLFEQR